MWTSWMVDTPRKMKISVSLTLLHIFRKYWMLVLLRSETLASTYCFMVTAQVTILQKKRLRGEMFELKPKLALSNSYAVIPER